MGFIGSVGGRNWIREINGENMGSMRLVGTVQSRASVRMLFTGFASFVYLTYIASNNSRPMRQKHSRPITNELSSSILLEQCPVTLF